MCSFQRYICWQRTSGVWRRMGQASSGKLTFHGNFSQVTILLSTQTLSIRPWGNLYRFWHLSLDYIIKHATWLSEENRYGKHSWGFNWLLCPQDSPGKNWSRLPWPPPRDQKTIPRQTETCKKWTIHGWYAHQWGMGRHMFSPLLWLASH